MRVRLLIHDDDGPTPTRTVWFDSWAAVVVWMALHPGLAIAFSEEKVMANGKTFMSQEQYL